MVLCGKQRLATLSPLKIAALNSSRQQAGGIYGAIILANDVFARLSMDQVMHEGKASVLTYRLFNNEEKAAARLREIA